MTDTQGSGRFEPMNDPVFVRVGICHQCVHQHKSKVTCKAFPNGIPDVILFGDYMHTAPFPGDQGIQFKQVVQ